MREAQRVAATAAPADQAPLEALRRVGAAAEADRQAGTSVPRVRAERELAEACVSPAGTVPRQYQLAIAGLVALEPGRRVVDLKRPIH